MAEPARSLVVIGLALILLFFLFEVVHALLVIAVPAGLVLILIGVIMHLVRGHRAPG